MRDGPGADMSEPLEQRFMILDWLGLHARAATRFANTAAKFSARIEVDHDGVVADGKNVIGLLTLVTSAGDEITVRADGPDAAAALAALTELVTGELGELVPRRRCAPAGAHARSRWRSGAVVRPVERAEASGPVG